MDDNDCALSRLFDPSPEHTLGVVVFASGGGSNFKALLDAKEPSYRILALFTDRRCDAEKIANAHGIPVIHSSFKDFFSSRGVTSSEDTPTRQAYDRETVRLLQKLGSVDLLVLAGYMRLVYEPLLEAFPDRIINVHPADLSQVDGEGRRLYIGPNGVKDALNAGDSATRSCVILVNREVDGGQVLVSGPWVPFDGGSIADHQERQKRESDWPALVEAVRLIAKGSLALDGQGNVLLDGNFAGPQGVSLEAAEV